MICKAVRSLGTLRDTCKMCAPTCIRVRQNSKSPALNSCLGLNLSEFMYSSRLWRNCAAAVI